MEAVEGVELSLQQLVHFLAEVAVVLKRCLIVEPAVSTILSACIYTLGCRFVV